MSDASTTEAMYQRFADKAMAKYEAEQRATPPRRIGPHGPKRKWTPDQVREMRQLEREGVGILKIAAHYGVSYGHCCAILRKTAYRDVE